MSRNGVKSGKKRVWVVGSKPSAMFPNNDPDVIYAANGAMSRIQEYGEYFRVGVLSSYLLESERNLNSVWEELNGCRVDKLIIARRTPYNPDVNPDDIGLRPGDVEMIRERVIAFKMVKLLGIYEMLRRVWVSRKVGGLLRAIVNTIIGKPIQDTKLSTGLLCLLLSMDKYNLANYNLIGIGLDPSTGHHYNLGQKYGSDHIDVDRWFLNCIVESDMVGEVKSDDSTIRDVILA